MHPGQNLSSRCLGSQLLWTGNAFYSMANLTAAFGCGLNLALGEVRAMAPRTGFSKKARNNALELLFEALALPR
jgi:hypothetical protein